MNNDGYKGVGRPRKGVKYWYNGFNISVQLHKHQFELLDKIVRFGNCKSRSELIRNIIDKYLMDYYKTLKGFELLTPEQIRIMGD